MNKLVLGTLSLLLLTSPAFAKGGCMSDLEERTEKIIEKFDHHIKKIREKENLNPAMKALLMKQAEETKTLRLKHLNERVALKMKQKKETEAVRNATDPNAQDDATLLYVEEIDILEPVNTPPTAGDVKNPNRQKMPDKKK